MRLAEPGLQTQPVVEAGEVGGSTAAKAVIETRGLVGIKAIDIVQGKWDPTIASASTYGQLKNEAGTLSAFWSPTTRERQYPGSQPTDQYIRNSVLETLAALEKQAL